MFARNFTEKLMTYALGRGVEYYDAPAVRTITREATPAVEAMATAGATMDDVGADVALVETVAHTQAALHFYADADVICDVGGQDIKIIVLRDGRVTDFRLNTQCSAGNGMLLRAAHAQLFPGPVNVPQEAMYWWTNADGAGHALPGCAARFGGRRALRHRLDCALDGGRLGALRGGLQRRHQADRPRAHQLVQARFRRQSPCDLPGDEVHEPEVIVEQVSANANWNSQTARKAMGTPIRHAALP